MKVPKCRGPWAKADCSLQNVNDALRCQNCASRPVSKPAYRLRETPHPLGRVKNNNLADQSEERHTDSNFEQASVVWFTTSSEASHAEQTCSIIWEVRSLLCVVTAPRETYATPCTLLAPSIGDGLPSQMGVLRAIARQRKKTFSLAVRQKRSQNNAIQNAVLRKICVGNVL